MSSRRDDVVVGGQEQAAGGPGRAHGPTGEHAPADIGATAASGDDLDRLRRRLANVVGHALRTPAATLRGQAEILAGAEDPADRQAAIDALRRTARRLEEMIDEVLVVEGLDTRLPTRERRALALVPVVREVADELEVVDDVEVVGDEALQVLAGPDALRWLLRTILDNAGRYGTGPVRVTLAPGDVGVELTVCTPGGDVGATDDDLRLGFEPFYRGERAVTVTATRLGVGLTAARRLAEELGGRIRLERGDAGETVTRLELPAP